MEKSYFLSATFNEVIFKDRNKGYGAYQLRQVYERNIKFAVLTATIVFAGALFSPLIKTKFFPAAVAEKTKYKDHGQVTILQPVIPEIEKPKIEEQLAVAPKEKVKTAIYNEPKIVPNDANIPDKTLANQDELKGAVFGNEQIDGVELATPDVTVTDEAPTGLDSGTTGDANNIFIYAEEMPEFNGGEKAMMNYIGKKINYPAAAQRENIQGLVVVTFVVAPNGEIRDAEVIKGLGYGTEEEALRVVKGMPKWKPGKQNGKPVAVRYTLPIRFSMR